ncbi:MAG: hypothetical protein WCC60_08770 [Ilumatobacteraceae bacterium]
MGLFSKKPKASAPETPTAPIDAEKPGQQKKAGKASAKPTMPPKPPKPPKSSKHGVDPTDFLALRSELMDVKARLEATEQAKALVETRLAALDATTTAMAADRPGSDDVQGRLNELQAQLGVVAETAAAAHANAENAAAKAAAAATVASNAANTPLAAPLAPPAEIAPDPMLLARIDALATQVEAARSASAPDPALAARLDELAAKVDAVHTADPAISSRLDELAAKVNAAAEPDPGLLARLDQLSSRIDGSPDESRLVELEARMSALSATPTQPSSADPDTLARIDQLADRVGAIDSFSNQLSQLNARVTAQAEFGAQLGSLRDRITELANETEDRRAAAFAATGDADLRDRVNALADRLASTDGVAAQIAQLAERVAASDTTTRQATEQVAAIEQRLNAVSTELANQVSELGRDIDGLAARSNEVAQGTVSDEVIDGLKGAQVKLAAEQARYEIAFRQDLAALAEQVRHHPRG